MSREEHRGRLLRGIRRIIGDVSPDAERALGDLEEPVQGLEYALLDLICGEGSPPGFDPERYLAPGLPRIRPLLVMLAALAAGGEGELESAEVASAAELLHLAVAIHDAALGRQGGRRRRIARRLLGGAAHWMGGNHLTLRALELARTAPTPEIMGEVLEALREIAAGHALAEDLRDREPTTADYREFAEGHTGAIFAFSTRAGGLLAGAPRPVVMSLGRYGRHMGVAWHALEDQCLFAAQPERMVQTLAHHAAAGRPVLPLLHATQADPSVGALFERLLAEGEASDGELLRDRIHETGGIFAARKMVAEESLAARRALRALPESPHRELLDRIAAGLNKEGARELAAGK